ncbi:MFS transporter [Streptomyces sp. NPDC094038]|uniref:MFS transporter n=1 Tax=Streptomyces sp. NPDC094038 TaxID=3366055 RepID=UPI00380A2C9C
MRNAWRESRAGLMPGYGSFLVLLFVTGCAAVTVTTSANALVQLHADAPLRGRVLSVHCLVLLGGTPTGAPLVGLVSDALGARFTLVVGGVISLVTALVLSVAFARRTRRRIRVTEPTPVTRPPVASGRSKRERQPDL